MIKQKSGLAGRTDVVAYRLDATDRWNAVAVAVCCVVIALGMLTALALRSAGVV
jgi:hypothetical protein